jgi:hypothetical protein
LIRWKSKPCDDDADIDSASQQLVGRAATVVNQALVIRNWLVGALLASILEEKRRLTREGKVKKTLALGPIKTQDRWQCSYPGERPVQTYRTARGTHGELQRPTARTTGAHLLDVAMSQLLS